MADTLTQNIDCRYFKNGVCREGSNCRYRHSSTQSVNSTHNESNNNNSSSTSSVNEPESNTVQSQSSAILCRFYRQGTCRYGSRCRFIHSSNSQSNGAFSSVQQHNLMDKSLSETFNAEEWANAPEFVPLVNNIKAGTSHSSSSPLISQSVLSYAQAVSPYAGQSNTFTALDPLCPYAEVSGACKKTNCTYLHGDICDLCNKATLHPHNEDLRKKHTNACVKQHEINMELSFAIQRSREKSCGVCFETIMEKSSPEQRFGILPNCNHCFCLSCIRKWRKAKNFDNKIIRACPECRIPSDFVCPSMYWVDTKEDKDKLITDYKDALSTKDCKYFNKGRGKCPFGNKCFYLHALPDGTKTDVGPPIRHRRNADNEIDIVHQLLLWDFMDDRDNFWSYSINDLQDIVIASDSDDSDWSEYNIYFD